MWISFCPCPKYFTTSWAFPIPLLSTFVMDITLVKECRSKCSVFQFGFVWTFSYYMHPTFFRTEPTCAIRTIMLVIAIWIFTFEHSIRKSAFFSFFLKKLLMNLAIRLMPSHLIDAFKTLTTFTDKVSMFFTFFTHICFTFSLLTLFQATSFLFTIIIQKIPTLCWPETMISWD